MGKFWTTQIEAIDAFQGLKASGCRGAEGVGILAATLQIGSRGAAL